MRRSLLFFAVIAAALLFPPAVRADNDTLPVPAFPLDEAGRIEIAGAGGSALTRQEMVSCTKEWIYDNFEEATIEEDTSSGSLRVSGSFLIVEEEQENLNTVMELMAYAVTVVCDDYRYAYSIDDVGAYVVTLVPFAEGETSGTEYEIVDSVYISLPGDYVVLMDDAYRERARLRGELEKMLAEDVSEYGRSRLRRYEQELQQTADWFTATDDYYRLVKENYMACYDHLTGLAETLRAALGAEE